MTKEELEYAALPQEENALPEGVSVAVVDILGKKVGYVYKDGVPVFMAKSKSRAYIVRRIKKFLNKTKEEK